MNIIKFPNILQNLRKNVNCWNFQNNCRVNSEIRVFVSTYLYKISVLIQTFFFAFGKATDLQSFKYKEYSVNCSQLF